MRRRNPITHSPPRLPIQPPSLNYNYQPDYNLNPTNTFKMKFSAATLFAAGAAAATMGKRSTAFEVSDFSAACIQHSSQCV